MGNPLPLEFNNFYHIYSRGNNKVNIFLEDRNYEFFKVRYVKYINTIADTFLAFCFLKNHFHLLIKIKPEEEIRSLLQEMGKVDDISKVPSSQFSHLLNSYSKAINKAYDRTGNLFQRPFQRKLILTSDQLFGTIAYIHQNPIKHQFTDDTRDWVWSSFYEVYCQQYQIIDLKIIEEYFGSRENYLSIAYPMEEADE